MSDIEQRVKKIVAEQLGAAEADVKNASSRRAVKLAVRQFLRAKARLFAVRWKV